MAELTNLIGSIGFPAVMCLYMCYHNNKTLDNMMTVIKENTVATNKLVTLITHFLSKGDE